MRNGQNKHRMRGRNRGGKSHNPLTRVYESNGPDVKIRGTANHVAEKYIQLARDATASGDPVAAENYYQHAEHYFRLIAAAQEQFRQTQPFQQQREGGDGRSDEGYDGDDEQPNYGSSEPYSPQAYQQQQPPREGQPYQPREQREQPYQQREQRGDYQPRHDRNREHRQDNRNDNRHDSRQPDNRQPQQANGGQDEDVERLPSFITGTAPAASGDQPNGGYEGQGQGERFPLHRRRRRGARGPRAETGGEGGDDTQPQGE